MHVIRHQMPFFDPTFLLLRQPPEHFPKMLPQLSVQNLLPVGRSCLPGVFCATTTVIHPFFSVAMLFKRRATSTALPDSRERDHIYFGPVAVTERS